MPRPDPHIWESLLAYLRRHHAIMCRHWFDDIEPLDISGGTLKLLVREVVHLRYLQRTAVQQFTEAAQAVTGHLLSVKFVGERDIAEERFASRRPAENSAAEDVSAAVHPTGVLLSPDAETTLSPDFSFANFVVGPENRLAHAGAIAVTKDLGRVYNPFFVHGGVGLGKTHLLQAMCQAVLNNNPSLKIYYISCDTFMNLFHDAVQAGVMAEFRNRFRSADMLVVDDIHDLSKRERSQEEFFHTFNALRDAGKHIVLSSDAVPSEIPQLKERLVSRFASGLVARIDKPCFETRVAIVKSKSALRSLQLPDEVAEYIAQRIESNIRELEGAINSIQHSAAMLEVAISLELAKRVLGDQASAGSASGPTIQVILEAVTSFYDLKLTDLLSRRRHKSVALPRQVGMWMARKHTRYSLQEIGGYFGGRDHTTVMHAIRTIDDRCNMDLSFRQDISRLEDRVAVVHPKPGPSGFPPNGPHPEGGSDNFQHNGT
ncbi:MAG TPA: chromosomal replication initiator protein DnaA [Phycisphaerales bacterium]|nr:chromosomal replication initiator protein DnaA [Phycisphaerales bacterium]